MIKIGQIFGFDDAYGELYNCKHNPMWYPIDNYVINVIWWISEWPNRWTSIYFSDRIVFLCFYTGGCIACTRCIVLWDPLLSYSLDVYWIPPRCISQTDKFLFSRIGRHNDTCPIHNTKTIEQFTYEIHPFSNYHDGPTKHGGRWHNGPHD